ncbi:hypothetical protein C8J27_101635 [Rhodobacter aestuarii]|uniref:Uncharacterized protein n=1 Tax=Rhodobacter aestuarii TaxID=453582 RepID=A0A1N7IUC2_9RHOB|nr:MULTISPECIES: hypothetical protein [Rhodobacter]PTV97519.1 hypothetical protein C8J27_101635 [Rhodobacter aestuarii]SIS40695.1 hypothetical protein SAMN05421580_1017 [Rhodobacter aestuarii]SOC05362.1 hypothetical protein SAMN05877809_103428 [Rhodobacter sp. JA431]
MGQSAIAKTITRQPPQISCYGNVTLYLWRAAGFSVAVNSRGKPQGYSEHFTRAEVEEAIAPYLRAL